MPLRGPRRPSELPSELLEGVAALCAIAAIAGGDEVVPAARSALAQGDDVIDLFFLLKKERARMNVEEKALKKKTISLSLALLFFFSHRQPPGARDTAVLACF